jgi:hypothetical protein
MIAIAEAAMNSKIASTPPSEAKFVKFSSLPTEIRDLIWEATLPPRRLFHVSGSTTIRSEQGPTAIKLLTFHVRHRHPVATRVCRESREAALRRGFFFRRFTDVWFNPDRDMLYIDRNQRRYIQTKDGKPLYRIAGLDRVKHVAVEWRAWFRDIPALQSQESMCARWRHALRSLRLYTPNLETVNFVLPQTRYCGGMGFGREPYGSWKNPCDLIPLPEHANIPWGKTAPPGVTHVAGLAMGSVSFGRQLTVRLTSWETIRAQMVDALAGEAAREQDGDLAVVRSRVPRIVGWWLIRMGGAVSHNQPEVRTFRS